MTSLLRLSSHHDPLDPSRKQSRGTYLSKRPFWRPLAETVTALDSRSLVHQSSSSLIKSVSRVSLIDGYHLLKSPPSGHTRLVYSLLMLNSKTYMASMTTYVCPTPGAMVPSRLLHLQLLNFVSKPVKAVILLFPIRGKKARCPSILRYSGSSRPYVSPTSSTRVKLLRWFITRPDQQRVWHDWPAPRLDKRKID